MIPREQKESVFGLEKEEEEDGKEEGEEEGERKRGEKEKNSFTKHVFINGFLDSVLSEVCKKERKRKTNREELIFILSSISQPGNIILLSETVSTFPTWNFHLCLFPS